MENKKPVRLEAQIAELEDTIWSNALIFSIILAAMFPYDFKLNSIIYFLISFSICIIGIIFQIVKLKNLKKRRG